MVKTKRGMPDMTYLADRGLYRKRGTYNGQRYNITAKDPNDVMAKIEAFKAAVDGAALPEDITVWSYIQRWFPSRTAGLKPKTVASVYSYPIDNYIIPHIGNILMKDVKPQDIDNLMAKVAGKSASLNHKILLVLNQIFRSAAANDVITKNPCIDSEGKKRKPGGKRAAKKKALTRKQQGELAFAVRGTRAELFVLLCMYAGLRREEALGLLWADVHLDGDSPHLDICNAVTFDNAGRPTHSPELKSEAAYRTIPIPPVLFEALSRRKGGNDSLFVVPSETTGQEMSLSAFRRMWQTVNGYSYSVVQRGDDGKPAKDEAGKSIYIKKLQAGLVCFHVHPHLLRHTYITELCISGMDIKKIQYLAGHETVQMTLDIYADVVGNRPEDLAPIINSHFSTVAV